MARLLSAQKPTTSMAWWPTTVCGAGRG